MFTRHELQSREQNDVFSSHFCDFNLNLYCIEKVAIITFLKEDPVTTNQVVMIIKRVLTNWNVYLSIMPTTKGKCTDTLVASSNPRSV